jgi:Swt1-like HEPN
MNTEKAALQRVQGGLYHLRRGLSPFVKACMVARHGANWLHYASRAQGASPGTALDEYGLLKTMLDNWREVFDESFGRSEKHRVRNFTSMALEARHAAYHLSEPIQDNEALRYLDAMHQLVTAVKASEDDVRELKRLYDEQRHSGLSAPDAPETEAPPPPPPNENMNPAEARRRVNQRCKLAVLDRNNTHFANINKTRRDIWWLDIPLEKVEGPRAEEIINLLLYNDLSNKLYHLRVPTSYLRENLIKLKKLRDQIDLWLSTDKSKLFEDERSKCRFQHLLCGCAG